MWFGYARSELVPDQARDELRITMHDYASAFDFGAGQVFFEPTAPEQVLRSMLEELDARDPVLGVMLRLEQVAEAWGVDLGRVFDPNSPRTQVLWSVMGDLENRGGGHLLVPSRAHLTGLGPSGRAMVQRITRMPQAHIYYLDADQPAVADRPTVIAPVAARQSERVLVESQVDAIATLTRFDMVAELTRRGWPHLIKPVDKLYMELVEDANRAVVAAGGLGFGPGGNDGVIRLLHRDDGLLVVELEENRQRRDVPADGLKALSAQVLRVIDRGRTFTRATLPAQYGAPAEAVSTVFPGAP